MNNDYGNTNYPNNGRVSDIRRISNYRKIDENILYDNSRETSLKGILEPSKVSNIFFSNENQEILQKNIRYGVYQEINKKISKQSKEELITIMRSIYLQEGGQMVNSNNEVIEEIKKLNDKVINYSVKHIVVKLKQHDMYLNDLSRLPVPIDRPQYDKKTMSYDMSNLL